MSLEQYKDASRKELWDILQIQMQVLQAEVAKVAELELKVCSLDLTKGHLKQCEEALESRDAEIAELEKENKELQEYLKELE